MKEKHFLISGRVQGVGFRHFTTVKARNLGLKGWVKNLPDGRVEAVIQGEAEKINKMADLLRQGPPSASVREIKSGELKNPEEIHDHFFVKR